MTLLELGSTAQSTYLERKGSMSMLPLDEAGSEGGAAAGELVQSTLDDFSKKKRKPHSEETRQKISEALRGRKRKPFSEEHRRKLSEAGKGKPRSDEYRAKISASMKDLMTLEKRVKLSELSKKRWQDPDYRARMSGENHPKKRPEARVRMSKWSKKRWQDPDYRAKRLGKNNPIHKPDIKRKHRASLNKPDYKAKMSEIKKGKYTGSENPAWKGGVSFEPYCPKFNDQLRESIRNRDSRTCVLCGKSELLNGRRLAVHHIDGSKTQGCRGEKWYLCALCVSCNSRPDTVEKEFLIVTSAEVRRSGL